ncbi:MAG: hypothetical protein N2316_01325, partial [Spirochaetes bacterium]|nr:hypothetical protein [Spirochaetota bacterium]
MRIREFKASISQHTKNALIALLPSKSRRQLLYSLASKELTIDQVPLFEQFVLSPGFRLYIRTHQNVSSTRWEKTFRFFFHRLSLGIPANKLGEIIGAMSSKKYIEMEKSFFHAPIDLRPYELFQSTFITIGEYDIEFLDTFLNYCRSHSFADLKKHYLSNWDIFSDLFKTISEFFIHTRSLAKTKKAVEFFILPYIKKTIEIYKNSDVYNDFIALIVDVLKNQKNLELFTQNFKYFYHKNLEKCNVTINKHDANFIANRTNKIIQYLQHISEKDSKLFKKFVHLYGDPKDEIQLYIWNTVFELDAEIAKNAIFIFTSNSFISLKSNYLSDTNTLQCFIGNIIAILKDNEIHNIQSLNFQIIFHFLILLRTNRAFLKRRIEFIKWLKTKSSSSRLEFEVLRFLFFESVFIALKLVINRIGMKMTKFCDNYHKRFVLAVDYVQTKVNHRNQHHLDRAFAITLFALREKIWEPLFKKYSAHNHIILKLKNIAETYNREDAIIGALESMESADLIHYYRNIEAAFHSSNFNIEDALRPDCWYRLPFHVALPYVIEVLTPLVGTINVVPSDIGAYTDSRNIYLPRYISDFKDPLFPITRNRNLTMYVGMALHEAGHILGGTFLFDINRYCKTLKNPAIYQIIAFLFEDYRIDEFLVRIHAHLQAAEIIKEINRFYNNKIYNSSQGMGLFLILHIISEASNTN